MKLLPLVSVLVVATATAYGQTAEEKIVALEKRVAKLEEALAKLQTAPAPAPKPGGSSTNKHGIPDAVFAKIKAKAESTFPDDFSTQKYVIENEVKAYKALQEK